MEVKRVKCPNCGIVLEVRNSRNEAVKLISCPQCSTSLRVHFQAQQPMEAETVYPGRKPYPASRGGYDDDKTILPGRKNAPGRSAGNLDDEDTVGTWEQKQERRTASLVLNGQQFALKMGLNTVGRKAQTSQATLQLPVDDVYLSRHHARLELKQLPNGRLKTVISNDRNKNATTINGVELLADDAVILTNGDRIVMGKTTVVYQER